MLKAERPEHPVVQRVGGEKTVWVIAQDVQVMSYSSRAVPLAPLYDC
jgi:hypothetical protein